MSLPKSIIWISFSLLLWFVAFYDAILSAFGIWMDSATYNHCLFVIPISVYLIWQKVPALMKAPIKPSYLGLLVIIGMMLLWGLGFAGKINVFQHVAAFSILPLIVVASIGLKAASVIWFPLFFTLFSIPVGEELIPLFQEITADLSVQMLLWSGIPVFREGLFIQVPGGKFLVAEACSGIRFFVSTVMLGALCAYIFFSSTKKKLLFIVFSVLLPIIANAIRAYGIMLVGYLSGMEHAVGADHLIYGWVFFAIVTGLLIFVANAFKDDEASTQDAEEIKFASEWFAFPSRFFMVSFVAIFAGFFAWKILITKSIDTPMHVDIASLTEALGASKTQSLSPFTWQPIFNKADVRFQANAKYPNQKISFHYFAFTGKNKAELISWENRVFDPEEWTLEKANEVEIVLPTETIKLTSLELYSNMGQSKSVVYWYQVPGLVSSQRLKVKIMQAINVLIGKGNGGVFMSVSTDGINKTAQLSAWLKENYKTLTQAYIMNDAQPSNDIEDIAELVEK